MRVCALSELADGDARRFEVNGVAVAVVRIGGDVFAISDICTHADVSLSEGYVDHDQCTLECFKHGSAFSLRTGVPETLPATRPVAVYPVTVDGDSVSVEVPS